MLAQYKFAATQTRLLETNFKITVMKMFSRVFFSAAIVAASLGLQAQDDDDDVHNIVIGIPEVALVDIEGSSGTSINLGPTAPTEAGLALDFSAQTNNDLWINYSSIKHGTNDPTRDITAKISSGTVPAGMDLIVTAGADASNGDGTMGSSTGAVTLTGSDQDVITGIGSAYTANGVSNGHNLTYSLSVNVAAGSYAQLDAEDANTVSVTYTISDN